MVVPNRYFLENVVHSYESALNVTGCDLASVKL